MRRLLPTIVKPVAPVAVVLVAVALAAAGCGSGSKARTVSVDQAATVDGVGIPVARLTELAKVSSGQGTQQPGSAETTRSALESLIQSQVVLGGARAEGVTVSDTDVASRLNDLKAQVASQGGNFDEALRQRNLTVPILENQLRVQLAAEKVAAKLVPGQSDAKLLEALGKRKDEFLQLHVRHVLVKDEATAKKVRGLLVDKGDWAGVAKRYSTDPGSKDKGGDLGFESKGQTVAEFEKATFKLAGEGDCKGKTGGACTSPISDPVKSQYGWHVIQVTGVQLPQLNAQLRDQLEPGLSKQRQDAIQAWFSKHLKAAKVTVNPRFGRWDAATGKVVDRETAPRTTPETTAGKQGSATTTTQP
ncbi:MAG TPA: peptidylprolyl isomerase [Actinomycetota bacterium]|nr:peptidylprolyl isomerase [Actinomycetota bacterium]